MLEITCPHCGPRPETEFSFGGQAHLPRPSPPSVVSDEAWGAYLFLRDNPRGAHAECWRHSFGCAEWVCVLRDTVTHELLAVYPVGAPRPEVVRR